MSSKVALLFMSAFISATSAFASSSGECEQQAQISAKITSVDVQAYTCIAHVTLESTSFYQASQVCPLDQVEVLSVGINVGLKNSHQCSENVGDSISGVLYKDSEGALVLESDRY